MTRGAQVALACAGLIVAFPTSSFAQNAPSIEAPRSRFFGNFIKEIRPCTQPYIITKTYVLTINNLNLRNLNERWKLTGSPGDPPRCTPSGCRASTKWDLALELRPGEAATLRVEINDNKVSFIENPFAITSGQELGTAMFCGLTGGDNDNYRSITAYYNPTSGLMEPLNIGVIIKDHNYNGSTNIFTIPVFIDPNIKNNG